MKKLSYLELGIQALKELNHPATYREIWEYIQQKGLYKQLKSYNNAIGIASIGKTLINSVNAHLYTEAKKKIMGKYTQKATIQSAFLSKNGKEETTLIILK